MCVIIGTRGTKAGVVLVGTGITGGITAGSPGMVARMGVGFTAASIGDSTVGIGADSATARSMSSMGRVTGTTADRCMPADDERVK